MQRLREKFNTEVVQALMQEFDLPGVMSVPKIIKVVVNAGVGKLAKDTKVVDAVVSGLAKITGQVPVKTEAKKSIAGFGVRAGQVVGVMLTLRGDRMYSFLDRLVNVALPRVRDFRGIKVSGFDGRGNYNLGLKEQSVFPELSSDNIDQSFGLEITVVTNSGRDDQARRMLNLLGFPFIKFNS